MYVCIQKVQAPFLYSSCLSLLQARKGASGISVPHRCSHGIDIIQLYTRTFKKKKKTVGHQDKHSEDLILKILNKFFGCPVYHKPFSFTNLLPNGVKKLAFQVYFFFLCSASLRKKKQPLPTQTHSSYFDRIFQWVLTHTINILYLIFYLNSAVSPIR